MKNTEYTVYFKDGEIKTVRTIGFLSAAVMAMEYKRQKGEVMTIAGITNEYGETKEITINIL